MSKDRTQWQRGEVSSGAGGRGDGDGCIVVITDQAKA